MPDGCNEMVVVLIPKVPQLERIKYLRPTSLCTVILQDSIHGDVQQAEAGLIRNHLAEPKCVRPGTLNNRQVSCSHMRLYKTEIAALENVTF